jgi:outer membrane protein insertion porin family
MRKWIAVGFALAVAGVVAAQTPSKTYTLAGLSVVGAEHTDVQAIKLFSALEVGGPLEVPGVKVPQAIRNLWDQDLFGDVSIEVAERRGDEIYLVIRVEELPRLTRYTFEGVSRSEQETLRGKIELLTGRIVNENVIATATKRLRDHYIEKGFWDARIDIRQEPDEGFANGSSLQSTRARRCASAKSHSSAWRRWIPLGCAGR